MGVLAPAWAERYELNTGWLCHPSQTQTATGEEISKITFSLHNWKPAVVPGTVLTTLLANKEIPDPFFGLNNEKIPDIYNVGRAHYTYWFVNNFEAKPPQPGEQLWLTFRGINYSCDIFLNGKKVNPSPCRGMFLRHSFNISSFMSPDGKNRLAVIVFPPDHVGEPNGGQGGDGHIARNVAHQYVAGWDWIQPIRDRNTGIWDKVFIERTGKIRLINPRIDTQVPGLRLPENTNQAPAYIQISAELQNPTQQTVPGKLSAIVDGHVIASKDVNIQPQSIQEVTLPTYQMNNPKLWWPAGYGEQNLYAMQLTFHEKNQGRPSDTRLLRFGVRELTTAWNEHTRSRQFLVNGQKIFIRGGNWIVSDAMLRLSPERYDSEIRHHRDMNLNLIRVWGGALTERPEFYDACDRYGLLVMQDFWFSADCNGRWVDPQKADDQWTRRRYPDDHALAIQSIEDMVKMVRCHPSLAAWCGGNEIPPPQDILKAIRNDILPRLDPNRWFIDYSNSYEMSYNSIGGNGDGPYRLQPIASFWQNRTWPFNSEVGSVGVGDYESLERFLPQDAMTVPMPDPQDPNGEKAHDIWTYHKYTGVGYESSLIPYGPPKDIRDFTRKAQLVNYDQYRALSEGFTSHMWDWYTGFIIWKTQNPWTAMRGQMYDYYLDPNACLYGTKKGGERLHAMCNPVTGDLFVVNNSLSPARDIMLSYTLYDIDGKVLRHYQIFCYINASDCQNIMNISQRLEQARAEHGAFLHLKLMDAEQKLISDNFYWYPNKKGEYSGLQTMKETSLNVTGILVNKGNVLVQLSVPQNGGISFFNRISIIDSATGKRILPAFYQDNYISIVPGMSRSISISYPHKDGIVPALCIEGWNTKKRIVPLH